VTSAPAGNTVSVASDDADDLPDAGAVTAGARSGVEPRSHSTRYCPPAEFASFKVSGRRKKLPGG